MIAQKIFSKSIYLHLLFWIGFLLISFPLFFNSLGAKNASMKVSITTIIICIIAYSNMYYFIPKFFERKKYIIYTFCISSLIVIASALLFFIDSHFEIIPKIEMRIKIQRGFPMYNFLLITNVVIISMVLKLAQNAKKDDDLKKQFQNQQLKAELDFLKAQINPHFLFNTLNNIYTLAYLKSDQAPEMISKLSELMRYMLYEGKEQKVSLIKEIDFLKNYISLYKLKNEDANVTFEVTEEGSISYYIEPLLFIPLIENCFKYCDLSGEKSFIHICLNVLANQITFQTANTVDLEEKKLANLGGIGLTNLAQRLNLLYANRHFLEIKQEKGIFTVNLVIQNLSHNQ